ncbi:ATP-dependent helicase [Paenibacillus sp. D2_2]|uniref:ATP-dependent helicase n=1 Tax=Paenibacillus sp. D2_2 TaxID=3073092 RepID=UPI002815A84F|nr:ATP-dependent helicase [Paenibacillus sp. D2_2]WMT40395.1 ATP-dependent helicase [Paenibacillus sp. D2_2]
MYNRSINQERPNQFIDRKQAELSIQLNEVQREAVLLTEGPLLLLASPGSGKTTTMIMRIGYLIAEKGVHPARIKAVTFSRAAAQDMKSRFSSFFPELAPVQFSTIHSFAFEVVRDYLRKCRIDFQIIEGHIDPEDEDGAEAEQLPLHKRIILRQIYQSLHSDNITDDQMDELTTYISYIKNKMLPAEQWSEVKVDVPKAEQIFRAYEEFKCRDSSRLLLDFDDMLTLANRALEEDASLLRKYQQRYDYVLTDESQDTSLVQHAIIEKLVQRHHNLCVVADDDQSIYSWRGAEPSYLLDFKQVFPKAQILYMEQNYRSSRDVVHAANRFIKRNKHRYNKNMFTHNPPHEPIRFTSLTDDIGQGDYLVREIAREENLAEIAILYRNNSSSVGLMNALDLAGIPFYLKDSDLRFFSHWVVEDVLNFMRLTYTDKRINVFEKIHMKFNGYISKRQMQEVKLIHNQESVFDNLLNHVPLQEYQVKLLQESKETFQQMRGMSPKPAIQIIRGRLGYEKALEKMCERLGFRQETLIGILNTLEQIAAPLSTMEEFAARLKYLESLQKTAKRRRGQNVVTLSTLHSAKGLEFDRVYMIDLVDGILPSYEDLKDQSEDLAQMEEATRLFYVGMTRAKRTLNLVTYQEREGKKAVESRFVNDIRRIVNPTAPRIVQGEKSTVKLKKPEVVYRPNAIHSANDFIVGKKVRHSRFDEGVISKVYEDRIEIQFAAGDKVLSIQACLEMGLLEPVETA